MARKSHRGFKTPLHLATGNDDLMPAMGYIYFEGDYMYATDAHIGVRANIREYTDFDEGEIKVLNGKFIHKKKFATLFKLQHLQITEDGILDVFEGVLYQWSKFNGPYVALGKNLEKHLSTEHSPIPKIGLDYKLLHRLGMAMEYRYENIHSLHLDFVSDAKAILVTKPDVSTDNLVGIIMPVRL